MAQNATIFKAQVQLSDMDKHLYDTLNLTLARHPSETDQRLMIRLLAFVLHNSDKLEFTKGLCADDEPELWQKNYADEIELWIELGQPDEKRLRKACAKAQQVVLYCYGGRTADIWFETIQNKLTRFDNLKVVILPEEITQTLAAMANRGMQLQCTIEDAEIWLSDMQQEVRFIPQQVFGD